MPSSESSDLFLLNGYLRDIWVAEARGPGGPQFTVATHLTLTGTVDIGSLRACVPRVLGRHDVFSVGFRTDERGEPVAYRARISIGEVELIDVSAELDPAASVAAWCSDQLGRGFALDGSEPLCRPTVLRAGPETVHLFLVAHHIVTDSWGLDLLTTEILSEYRRHHGPGPDAARNSPAPRYFDLTEDYLRYRDSVDSERDLEFFRDRLSGVVSPLFARRGVGRAARGRHSFVIDEKTARRIVDANASPFAYFNAALSICLARIHRSDEVIVGVPFLNRPTDRHREVVGHFANFLPLHVHADEALSLFDLSERIREDIRELRTHARLPIGDIVGVHDGDGDGNGRRQLFDVTVSYVRLPAPEPVPGITVSAVHLSPVHDADVMSIVIHAPENEHWIHVDLDYARDVFDEDFSVEAFAGHLDALLRRGLDAAELPVSTLSMLADAEYEDLVRHRQGETVPYSREKPLHNAFADQAAITPDLTAVIDAASGSSITYAELDRLANRVARAVRAAGAGPGDRVAVVAERGPELLPGLLGVLKAGAAYVPIDASYPAERIDLLVTDSRPALVLTSTGVRTQFSSEVVVRRIGELFTDSDAPLPPTARATDPAYVIYTSGSTGRPKGVIVEHHAVTNRLMWMQRRYPIGPGDTLLQKTPTAFDVSVWELFWWGRTGACVVVPAPGIERDPREIISAIREYSVTAVHFVPSMLGPFLEAIEQDLALLASVTTLRYVFCSGEALAPERVNRFNRLFAAMRSGSAQGLPLLVNLYGPTEAAIDVTAFDCPPAGPVTSVPIGRPVDNTAVYVLGKGDQPQPIGVPGELCIGGVQIARGYLDRPEITTERFGADPFRPGERLYRTGDLGRMLADGTIEYLGRIDDQVKIRGHRVELGEVSNALVAVNGVDDAVVIDIRSEDRGVALVGYYRSVGEVQEQAIRARLAEALPDHMIPAHLVRVDRIPLTPNGKVDRRALPPVPVPGCDADVQEPRTPTETALAEIWATVLGLQQVGVHADYFAVGGDSISMLKVRALAERAGIGFGLDDFVHSPTIAALAERADASTQSAVREPAVLAPFALVSQVDRARLGNRADAYPLSRLQLGLLFHSRERRDSTTYKDVFRYSLAMPWQPEAFVAAYAGLIDRHPALRSGFDLAGYSEPLQIVHIGVDPRVTVVDLRAAEDGHAEAVIAEHVEARRRFDYRIDQPELHQLRVFLLPRTVELLLSFHHAILDGGSVANLISELLHDYISRLGLADPPELDLPLPTPASFVAAERAAVADEASRAFWREELRGARLTQLIAFGPHEPVAPRIDLLVRDFAVPDDLTEAVHLLSDRRRVSVKSVLLAAHIATLREFCADDDVTTGLVTHGRPGVEHAERMCGLFLNTVPIRVDIARATWWDLVREVSAIERRLFPHRRVPLAVIQEDLGRPELIDTAFNFVHFRQLGAAFTATGVIDHGFTSWEQTNFSVLVNAIRGPRDRSIRLRMDFAPRQFTDSQADLHAATFIRLLRAIAEEPDAPASDVSARPRPAPRRQCSEHPDVVSAILDRARCTPRAHALRTADELWTYADLERAARRIAAALSRNGATPRSRVAIAMPRSPRSVVVLLAVGMAGCSAVPLDISYPTRRLEDMFAQSGAVLVVTADAAETSPDTATTFTYDALLDGSDDEPDISLPAVHAEDEAYLLFTSGSTGTPKAVAMPHRGLANLVAWQNSVPSAALGGRTLHIAPLSFDVSFQEIYSTLCGGGTLVIAPEPLRRDPAELLRYLDREQVERVFLPFVALRRLAEAADRLALIPQALRVVCSSGEQLRVTDELRRFLLALGPEVLLENQYGPTETHVVTAHTLSGDPRSFPALPPIGLPIDGAEVLVLDDALRPVPIGVRGEICVGGTVLADGYDRRAELTAERFVKNPHGRAGERLYRTGDLGMWLPDGTLVHLGRRDRQAKVRGHRVEPAEVELALRAVADAISAEIRDIAVVPREHAGGDTFLAAFLTGDPGRTDLSRLRAGMREHLPDHLVPDHFEWLTALPLTPSGKRDDATLGALPLTRASAPNAVAPRDAHERAVADILGELLGLSEIGVDDDVFDLGATSVTAMRATVLIEQHFGVGIPLAEFITAPTVAGLAQRVRASPGTAIGRAHEPLVAIKPDGTRAPLFLVHPMGGNVLCYVPLAKHLPPDQPLYVFQAAGTEAGTRPVHGVERLAEDYVAAMRRVQPHGPYHIGGWSFGGFVAFEMARQLTDAGERVDSLVLLDTTALGRRKRLWTDDDALLGWFFWELLLLGRGARSPEIEFPAHLTTSEAKFEFMAEVAVAEGVLPVGSGKQMVRRLFQVYEANWRSAAEYQPDGVVQDLVLIRAKQALPQVLLAMHSAIGSEHSDPANGWHEYTTGRVHVIEVEGDHLTIVERPHVGAVADALVDAMRTAEIRQEVG
ncbi:amino acid adenylation domain-containing protein [Nocardia sp. NPDC127606]|uniref:amino acid adenylation domain-containing protein n=1 Tax=Nocardia sp. NPDC127606 TaxID=3345406 RepID=UPI00362FF7D5